MTEPPEIIHELVERFERNIQAYKRLDYKEEQLKQEFLNPFFEALGWDVNNKSGAAPQHRDVIFEDSIKVAGGTTAPDYCFTLSGKRMFFLEAKKPSVNIKRDIHPAYQLRRYAWSAKLPVSVLSDFEEFAVYESRKLPKKEDKASTERIMYLTYKDYVDKWDEISSIFSRKAVLKGSFDRFVETAKKKRGTQEVDNEFLKEMERWRLMLARNFALRNDWLSVRLLNYAVQLTIDRILFLRICEDRGIEKYKQLQSLLDKENIYAELCKIYLKADDRYNSGLFHFRKEKARGTLPDDLTLRLTIDNKVLSDLIKHLYYPDCPYEFSVLPPEILGNVYEQFLGKVIRLTPGHRAKVEDKPEVKKAGGVYYTPKYIVDYIVENTVGKLCNGKSPDQISKFRILDPACGSGSFLLGAYTCLLEYHLDYYSKQKNKKRIQDKIYQGRSGEWQLDIREKKRILLNNIYGVDIDSQAVEVTKLSLLLKVLEGESRQLTIVKERALPDLGNNIKCGNSLIGPDFYSEGVQTTLYNENEMYRINAFDWNSEFKEIMGNGGFDAVISNPPYFSLDITADYYKSYLQTKFSNFATRQSNIYFFFIASVWSILKDNGLLSFINERYYFNSKNAFKFRSHLQNIYSIKEIIDFRNIQIFQNVNTLTVINTFMKSKVKEEIKIVQFKNKLRKFEGNNILDEGKADIFFVKQKDLEPRDWVFINEDIANIKKKLKINSNPLGDCVSLGQGIKSGLNKVFIVSRKEIEEYQFEEEILKKYVKTRDIQPYHITHRNLYLILSLNELNISDYPKTKSYLLNFQNELKKRYQYNDGTCKWYALSIPQNLRLFQTAREKILTPLYAKGNKFAYDECDVNSDYYALTDTFVLVKKDLEISLKFILGILNSKVLNFYNTNFGKLKRDGYYEYSRNTLTHFPIRTINFSDPADKARHDRMVSLVEQMLDLHKKLAKATIPHEKQMIQRQIDATDKQIDALVYELYGLTEEEIKIVEESVG